MKFLLPQWLFVAATVSTASAFSKRDIKTIPSEAVAAPITATFTSSYFGLDGPKLSAINESSFDWWYFDAVSTDLTTSLVITFYAALPSAFPFLVLPDVTTVGIYAAYPNGSISVNYLSADEAIIVTAGQGSSGIYNGTGASWLGAADNSWYTVNINSPSNGIVGTFNLVSKAPAHYPCGPVAANSNMVSNFSLTSFIRGIVDINMSFW
jgi:hypothetical protein